MCEKESKKAPQKDAVGKYSCKSCGAEADKEKKLCKPKKND